MIIKKAIDYMEDGIKLIERKINFDIFKRERDIKQLFFYDVVSLESEEIVGYCYLIIGGDKVILYMGNVSYYIEEKHRNKGYATKTLMCLINIARIKGMQFIDISILHDNIASLNVAKKAGAYFLKQLKAEEIDQFCSDNDFVRDVYRIEL